MKKIVSLIMTIVLSVVMTSTDVYGLEKEINTYYTKSYSSTLTLTGNSSSCKSKLTGYSDTTKIVILQSLQKKDDNGSWTNVRTSSTTIYYFAGTLTNTYSGLAKGTYRVKSVFTVYSGFNYEILTKCSSAKQI
ncbi:MAG: hypothetical protein K6C68_12345 [Ruminococcus sp.]|nr:hypothetical protein [Ruminococcus sp.]